MIPASNCVPLVYCPAFAITLLRICHTLPAMLHPPYSSSPPNGLAQSWEINTSCPVCVCDHTYPCQRSSADEKDEDNLKIQLRKVRFT